MVRPRMAAVGARGGRIGRDLVYAPQRVVRHEETEGRKNAHHFYWHLAKQGSFWSRKDGCDMQIEDTGRSERKQEKSC